jgi:hypothetical protein
VRALGAFASTYDRGDEGRGCGLQSYASAGICETEERSVLNVSPEVGQKLGAEAVGDGGRMSV